MKTTVPNKKSGSVLVIVVTVMVAFTLLVAVLLRLGSLSSIEATKQLRTTQAHYVAEAGLERALSWIFASADYREGLLPPPLYSDDEISLPDVSSNYDVEIEREHIGGVLYKYTITSTGTVSNNAMSSSATVQYSAETAPGLDYGFTSLGDGDSESYIKQSKSIDIEGDIYVEGYADIKREIDGVVEDADDDIPVDYIGDTVPVDPIEFEKMDTADYEALNNYASNTNNADVNVIPGNHFEEEDITFDGTTQYYYGDVTITDTSGSGGGTIVATGSISINGNKNVLPGNADLVAGTDITFNTGTGTAGDNELFAFQDITFNSNTDLEGTGTSLLAMGGIKLEANSDFFAGIIYAEGTYANTDYGVIFDSGTQKDFSGAVIAWNGFEVQSNLKFTYDPSVFAEDNPINWGDNLIIVGSGVWQQEPDL